MATVDTCMLESNLGVINWFGDKSRKSYNENQGRNRFWDCDKQDDKIRKGQGFYCTMVWTYIVFIYKLLCKLSFIRYMY